MVMDDVSMSSRASPDTTRDGLQHAAVEADQGEVQLLQGPQDRNTRVCLQHALAAAMDSTNGVRQIQFITCPITARVELNTHNDTHSNLTSQ